MVSLVSFLINIPVNNFSVILGRSHHFMGINQYFGLAQGHYTVIMVSVCVLIKSASPPANLSLGFPTRSDTNQAVYTTTKD